MSFLFLVLFPFSFLIETVGNAECTDNMNGRDFELRGRFERGEMPERKLSGLDRGVSDCGGSRSARRITE